MVNCAVFQSSIDVSMHTCVLRADGEVNFCYQFSRGQVLENADMTFSTRPCLVKRGKEWISHRCFCVPIILFLTSHPPLLERSSLPPNAFCCIVVTGVQTGAGKTHTMEGYPDPPELRGIIPKSFEVPLWGAWNA